MIDLKRLRDEPEYRRGVERKRVREGLVDAVLAAYDAESSLRQATEMLRAEQNKASKEIGKAAPEERQAAQRTLKQRRTLNWRNLERRPLERRSQVRCNRERWTQNQAAFFSRSACHSPALSRISVSTSPYKSRMRFMLLEHSIDCLGYDGHLRGVDALLAVLRRISRRKQQSVALAERDV